MFLVLRFQNCSFFSTQVSSLWDGKDQGKQVAYLYDINLPEELLRDSKSIKTESTSRESDEHLQFREVAILRRKNKRLQ